MASSVYKAGEMLPRPGTPEEVEEYKLTNMADAMALAKSRSRAVDDGDPDPYGYAQELEQEFGVDLITPNWKAKPDDAQWVKRLKGRARKAAVARLFLQGYAITAIAGKVKVSEVTVYKDLQHLGQEWRKSYLDDIEVLAGKDLTRLDYLFTKLAPGIERGDTKSVTAAIEIIKERAQILGYRQGVQIDIEAYVREVAMANGFDPDKAVQLAQRISITMR